MAIEKTNRKLTEEVDALLGYTTPANTLYARNNKQLTNEVNLLLGWDPGDPSVYPKFYFEKTNLELMKDISTLS